MERAKNKRGIEKKKKLSGKLRVEEGGRKKRGRDGPGGGRWLREVGRPSSHSSCGGVAGKKEKGSKREPQQQPPVVLAAAFIWDWKMCLNDP